MPRYYFFPKKDGSATAVTKNPELPDGEFEVTEYTFEDIRLWFLVQDNFTEEEVAWAFLQHMLGAAL